MSGLDRLRLAIAMNEFERTADLSVIVETNLGTHRPDCGHVAFIASEYDKVPSPEPEGDHVHRGAWCDVCVVYGMEVNGAWPDAMLLAQAMEIADDTPLLGTGLTRSQIVIREYARLASTPDHRSQPETDR